MLTEEMFLNKNSLTNINNWILIARESGAVALIDKDKDWTSFDVVAKLRNRTKVKKVGHAGTLDPLATGLLILCFGNKTKEIDSFQGLNKVYTGTIKIGAATDTDDSEGEETDLTDISDVTREQIFAERDKFIGEIEQFPPKFSAKKIKGKRLYDMARKGQEFETKSSKVTVYRFDITAIELPYLSFEIECSKGTYIRSIARDIGKMLGVGGYLYDLRRTAIGSYSVEDAIRVEDAVREIEKLGL
jgi:tRNA pseudouridine55 synthase